MAKELQVDYVTGRTVYFLLRSAIGQIWNGTAFENYTVANYANYPIAATEQGTSGYYTANMPAAVLGFYGIVAKDQVGGSAAQSDPSAGVGNVDWTATAVQTFPTNFSSMVISAGGYVGIQSNITKNTALNNFDFLMVLSSDHVTGATGKAITATRSIDGGAFAACANAVTEVSGGVYVINLAASDLNGTNIMFQFTASGCDTRWVGITTTP